MDVSHPSAVVSAVLASSRARRKKTFLEDAYNKAWGERISAARKQRRLSQQQVADFLQIGLDQYKKHELGKTAFPPYLLASLATILDKTLTWVVTGHG